MKICVGLGLSKVVIGTIGVSRCFPLILRKKYLEGGRKFGVECS